MKTRGEGVRERIERMMAVLRQKGVRLTPQRLEIYREVAGSEEHPDAEIIYRRIRKRLPMVSLDTVYRTLWFFKDVGLIQTLGGIHEHIRFDANVRPHHHFVCETCGAIHDFEYDTDRDWKPPHSVAALGDVRSTHIELRGTCTSCRNKTPK